MHAITIGILAAAIATPLATGTGKYVDSTGKVWNELPKLSDYPSAEAFDARFATEVFTTADGHRFQIDRPWTAEEESYYRMLEGFIGQNAGNGSGNGLRATVTCTHPVDEEYQAAFPNRSTLRRHVIDMVELADNALESNWGINLVPRKGYNWDSNDSGDIVDLLNEAYNEGGRLNGQDMMIALSNDPTPGGAIGVAYLGLPRQLVKKYGSQSTEAAICQHETGHTYTLQHCCDGNCIMQAFLDTGAFGNFHNYSESCSGQNHANVMNNQRNRY